MHNTRGLYSYPTTDTWKPATKNKDGDLKKIEILTREIPNVIINK